MGGVTIQAKRGDDSTTARSDEAIATKGSSSCKSVLPKKMSAKTTLAAALIASAVAAALAQAPPAPPAPLYHVLKGTSHLKGPCYQQDYVDLDFRRKGYVDGACPKMFNKVLATGHETVCTGQSDENIKYCQGKTTTYNTTEFGIQAFADETEKLGAGDSTTPCCKVSEPRP